MTFRAGEAHHLYWGLGLMVFGALLGGIWGWVCGGVGAILVVDDLAQHFLGVDPSPIHRFYVAYLWPIPVVQRLNRWLDKVMA